VLANCLCSSSEHGQSPSLLYASIRSIGSNQPLDTTLERLRKRPVGQGFTPDLLSKTNWQK
jgi:hypothetical protein